MGSVFALSYLVFENVMRDRYQGALLELAIGDALRTTVEFRAPGTFPPLEILICKLQPLDKLYTKPLPIFFEPIESYQNVRLCCQENDNLH